MVILCQCGEEKKTSITCDIEQLPCDICCRVGKWTILDVSGVFE